ncbi:hypothetical protein MIR68_005963 [Amoeboaphelidium protococcarum]|nr:hypothetical protein MIR68_005963 [Amoeboaphelidium protococcarum]
MSQLYRTYASAIALVLVHTSINVVYKVAQTSGSYPFSTASSLTMSELIKMCISIVSIRIFDKESDISNLRRIFSWRSIAQSIRQHPSGHSVLPTTEESGHQHQKDRPLLLLAKIFGLAALYALNNNLSFYLFKLVDPATISLFKSVSSFSTAILMFFLLSRPIYRTQWFAIIFQCLGLVMFQWDPCVGKPLHAPYLYLALCMAVSITTISSVWNDFLLKNVPISLNSFNAIMYGFGVLLNFCFYIHDAYKGWPSFFTGYTGGAWLVVFCNSIIGIVITLVYKYGDALVKTFASSITAVLLMVISSIFFGLHSTLITWLSGMIVIIATYMYATGVPQKSGNNSNSHQKSEVELEALSKSSNEQSKNQKQSGHFKYYPVLLILAAGSTIGISFWSMVLWNDSKL